MKQCLFQLFSVFVKCLCIHFNASLKTHLAYGPLKKMGYMPAGM